MSDPIDATPSVPPPGKKEDAEYITRDIAAALERAVLLLVERKARATGLGRRKAAALVLQDLAELDR